jgi:hypothetical protein
MKFRDLLEKWNMTTLKVNVLFLEMEWTPNDEDKDAAWEMYIELITRVATQDLLPEHGDEKTALTSVFKLFEITREIIKRKGRQCESFTKLAIIILNQRIRPFTAKWHRISVQSGFTEQARCDEFRAELSKLQSVLRVYCRMLADVASVEDITSLEEE